MGSLSTGKTGPLGIVRLTTGTGLALQDQSGADQQEWGRLTTVTGLTVEGVWSSADCPGTPGRLIARQGDSPGSRSSAGPRAQD